MNNNDNEKLIRLIDKDGVTLFPYTKAELIKGLTAFIQNTNGVCKFIEVDGTFQSESTITASLTTEQLGLLEDDGAVILIKSNYMGYDVLFQLNDFADNAGIRQYSITTKNYEIIANINKTSGALTCTIDYNYNSQVLISSSGETPSINGIIGILHENSNDGTLSVLQYKIAGLYDGEENLLVKWEDSGIDNTCSNAGVIIANNYPKTRIVRVGRNVTHMVVNGWTEATMVTKLFIPDSVTQIDTQALGGMIGLEEISVPFCGNSIDSTYVAHTFGIIFDQTRIEGTTLAQQYVDPIRYHGNFIPNTLRKATIRHQNTNGATRGMDGLVCVTDVVLCVTNLVEECMFLNAASVQNVELHCTSDTTIGATVFNNSAVKTLILPSEVVKINTLKGVENLYCLSTVPPILSGDLPNIANIYVPSTSVISYRTSWGNYIDKIQAGSIEVPEFNDDLKEWNKYWTAKEVQKYVESKGGLTNLIEATYSELRELMDANKLVPGCYYRITDYNFIPKTDYSKSYTLGTLNHQFDLIVLATTTSTINDNAKAIVHAETSYFTAEALAMWEITYTVNNWLWTDPTNGKGTIMWMKDDNGNQAPYDFKNLTYITDGVAIPTFSNSSYADYSSNNKCYGNNIASYVVNNTPVLNNIKLISSGAYLMGNVFENNCHNIKVYDSNDTLYNNYVYDITGNAGSSISSSKFGSQSNNITLTGFINSLICGDACSNSSFTCITRATLGAGCAYITITGKNLDKGNTNIVLGARCEYITIGNLNKDITIGDIGRYIYILENCRYINIGYNSSYIKLGSYSEHINFEGGIMYYIDYGYSDILHRKNVFFSNTVGVDSASSGQTYRKMAIGMGYDDTAVYKTYIKDKDGKFVTFYYNSLLSIVGYISADDGKTWTAYDKDLVDGYTKFNEEHPVNSRFFVFEGDTIPSEKYAKYVTAYGITFELDDSYNGRVIQCDNTQAAGTLIAESLPKIEGTVSVGPRNYTTTTTDEEALAVYNLSGAFTGTKNSKSVITDIDASFSRSGAETQANVINFKASDSNAVYSGDKVQPLAVTCQVYKRTA